MLGSTELTDSEKLSPCLQQLSRTFSETNEYSSYLLAALKFEDSGESLSFHFSHIFHVLKVFLTERNNSNTFQRRQDRNMGDGEIS